MARDGDEYRRRGSGFQDRLLQSAGHDGIPSTSVTILGRVLLWAAALAYTPKLANAHPASTDAWNTFMYGVYFVFHEAGHLVFASFGRFVEMAGGTIMQLLIPLAMIIYFVWRADRFSAAFATWWLGGSLATVAPYIYDARLLQKPLHGGGIGSQRPESHDWFYRLRQLKLLNSDQTIAWAVQGVAATMMWAAMVWAGLLLWGQWKSRYNPPKMGKYYKRLN